MSRSKKKKKGRWGREMSGFAKNKEDDNLTLTMSCLPPLSIASAVDLYCLDAMIEIEEVKERSNLARIK